MTKDKTLKLALEALEDLGMRHFDNTGEVLYKETFTTIKEALAQPEQEPVAYGMWDTMIGYGGRMMMVRLDKGQDGCTVPLYTTPPQRKPLTDAEIEKLREKTFSTRNPYCPVDSKSMRKVARAIEAAHQIGVEK